MADARTIKIEDHNYSQWPYWLFVPVEEDIWNKTYTHITRKQESIQRRQELTNKNIEFRFNKLWQDGPGIFNGKRKFEIWHRYKFKNKGDRLVFLMTHSTSEQ